MSAIFRTAKGALVISSEQSEEQFRALTQMIERSLAESSRRVYANTYRQWSAYAERDGLDSLDLSFENISAFLNRSEVAYATRQSWKTHMLRLLDWLEEADTNAEWYGKQRRRVLKFVKVKRMDAERGRQRSQRALNPTEVGQLLDVWVADLRAVGIRNHALLRLLIYTGLRRAEVVMLRWDDIDLEAHTVTVRHGKGDKQRIAAIADATEASKRALISLRGVQDGQYECVFPGMRVGRSPRFATDVPMSAQTIVRLLELTARRAGIGHVSAHDLRRTHITLALDNGAPLQDMQAQAGHANPSTTLRYAQPSDAKSRRKRIAF